MVLKKIFTLLVLSGSFAFAGSLDPKFFANRTFQNNFPGAFALQPESQQFVKASLQQTAYDADKLIRGLQADKKLLKAILNFPDLESSQKVQTMKQIFDLQTRTSGFAPPELILDDTAKRSTFFEFDPKNPNPGRVILNPAQLFKDKNPYAALLFLVHETRHSQQFQIAALTNGRRQNVATYAYKAAFTAQSIIFERSLKASFCDFLTLNNEYEAFLFGNYVLETLTSGAVPTEDMGTWASQYVLGQGLKINLPALAQKVGLENLLDAFNQIEEAQYNEMKQ